MDDAQQIYYQLYSWGDPKKMHFFKHLASKVCDVATGQSHAYFYSSSSNILVFGSNQFGQLAYPQALQYDNPTQISLSINVSKIYCGGEHTFFQTIDNQLYSMGFNIRGQLSLGDFFNRSSPSLVHVMLPNGQNNPKSITLQRKRPSRIFPFIQSIQKKQLPILNQGQFIVSLSLGTLHTLALSNKGRLFICGLHLVEEDEKYYSSGLSLFEEMVMKEGNIEKLSAGLAHSAVLIQGKVYLFGRIGKMILPYHQQVSFSDDKKRKIVDVVSGDSFSAMLSSKGQVFTIGQNLFGQLGISQIFTSKATKVSNLSSCSKIYAGKNHIIVYCLSNKEYYGWGDNSSGQVLMGKAIPSVIEEPTLIDYLNECNIHQLICSKNRTYMLSKKIIQLDMGKIINRQNVLMNAEMNVSNKQFEQMKEQMDALRNLNQKYMQQIESLKKKILIKNQRKNRSVQVDETDKKQFLKEKQSKFQIQGIDSIKVSRHRIFKNNLEIDFKQLYIEKQISQGGYGIIYKGKWKQIYVAIKKFKLQGMSQSSIRDFLSECHAMEAIRHPNIVLFLGACTKPPSLSIVLQFCENGSLWSVLQNHSISLTWEDRRRIAIQICRGVLYLHQCDPPILHRDLKSLNLLLDQHYRIKIADFGWTRTLSNYMTKKIGTYQWMAPQVINGDSYTQKADVFSFGIVMWQIASREPPYKNINGHEVSEQVIKKDLRPPIPKKCPECWIKLMKRCWDKESKKRPSFREIIRELEMIKLT